MRNLIVALVVFIVLILAQTAVWHIDNAIDQYAESIEKQSKLIERY